LVKQLKNRIIPQFDYKQIDSLVDDAMYKANVIDSQATVVASVRWFIGSYSEPTDEYSTYRNHFDIYIFTIKNRNFSVQKIDNFGHFRVEKIDASRIKNFLKSHFTDMQVEQLIPKSDTIHNIDGSEIITQYSIDHQLLSKIKIAMGKKSMEYKYPANFSNNKKNLLTYRFKFLKLLGEIQNYYEKQKHYRKNVNYEIHTLEH
jgi:hypothetical protein